MIWFKSLIPVAKILLILQLELKITLMYQHFMLTLQHFSVFLC